MPLLDTEAFARFTHCPLRSLATDANGRIMERYRVPSSVSADIA